MDGQHGYYDGGHSKVGVPSVDRTPDYVQLTESDAQFTYGLCKDCAQELYGQEKWYGKE
jgi:hypothetical protein